MKKTTTTIIRVSICLRKTIETIKDDVNRVITTLYDSACRYAMKKHKILKNLTYQEKMEIEELRESVIYVRFLQLLNYFNIKTNII